MTKILIVDDHPLIRAGLAQTFVEYMKKTEVTEAGSGEEALKILSVGQYDIAILDISMPGMTGLDLLKELKKRSIAVPVLVLSIHPENEYAIRAFKSGARGYLTKNAPPAELINAVKTILDGNRYITPGVTERLLNEVVEDGSRRPHELLSNREHHVMLALCAGKTISDIAREMGLHVKTISTFKLRILRKMRMRTVADITRYAVENSLI